MIATYVADTMEEAIEAVRPGANMLGVWEQTRPGKGILRTRLWMEKSRTETWTSTGSTSS